MNYTYTETDAHGALDAIIADKRVESYRFDSTINDFAWLQVTRQSFIDALEPTRNFRIRHEKPVSALAEAIGAMTYLFSNLETPAVDEAFSNFADALKAEILDRVEPGCLKPQGEK